MRLDHVSYAAEPDGLKATADRISEALGVPFTDGGYHPRFGTRNFVGPLADGRYVEVVEALEHPAAEKAPFGRAVRARSEAGGGWLGWVVALDDLAPIEAHLGREAVEGHRHRPDGVELVWRQIGVNGLIADPQLPFMISWECDPQLHPSAGGRFGEVTLDRLVIAGHPDRVRDWLNLDPSYVPTDVGFEFVNPNGTPGLMAVRFTTPRGTVEF